MDQFFSFMDPIALVGSLLVVVALVFLLYNENKKINESGLNTGDYINEVLLEGHAKWVLFFITLVSAAEALLAASIHPVGQPTVNTIARFTTHFAVNLGGSLMNIMVAHKISELVQSFDFLLDKKKANDPRHYMLLVFRLVAVFWVFFAAYYIPYLNYLTIAQGLGQFQMARWAVTEFLSPITGTDLSLVYQAYGYPPDFNPLEHLDYLMFASLGAMLTHYILGLYDSISAVIARLDRSLNPVVGAVSSYNQDVKKYTQNPADGIRYLIMKVGTNQDRQNVKQIVDEIVTNFSGLSPKLRSRIGINLSNLVSRWKTFEGGKNQDRKSGPGRTLVDDTLAFFRRSSKSGGLDRALSTRRTK